MKFVTRNPITNNDELTDAGHAWCALHSLIGWRPYGMKSMVVAVGWEAGDLAVAVPMDCTIESIAKIWCMHHGELP